MRNFFLVLFFSALTTISYSQSPGFYITGKVVNADTKAALQGASVFAENTTLGTATDAEGNFKLLLPNGGYELVITFTGFNTETKRINASDATEKGLIIDLRPKEKEMAVVSVVATTEVKDGWEKYGVFFLEQFIGKTNNSAACFIKNKEVLKFFFF